MAEIHDGSAFRNPNGIQSSSPALTVRAGQARNGYAGLTSHQIYLP